MPTADAPHLAGRRGNAKHLDTSVFAFERAWQGGPPLCSWKFHRVRRAALVSLGALLVTYWLRSVWNMDFRHPSLLEDINVIIIHPGPDGIHLLLLSDVSARVLMFNPVGWRRFMNILRRKKQKNPTMTEKHTDDCLLSSRPATVDWLFQSGSGKSSLANIWTQTAAGR